MPERPCWKADMWGQMHTQGYCLCLTHVLMWDSSLWWHRLSPVRDGGRIANRNNCMHTETVFRQGIKRNTTYTIISYPSEAELPCCKALLTTARSVRSIRWQVRFGLREEIPKLFTVKIDSSREQVPTNWCFVVWSAFSISIHFEGFGRKWPLCLERNLTLTSPKKSGCLLPVLKEQIRMNLNEVASKASSQVSYNISATTSQLGLPWGFNTVC